MNKELKKMIWCLNLFCIISLAGTIVSSVPVVLIYQAINGNADGNVPDSAVLLGMAIYRVIESLVFVMLFRKCTLTELKQEKVTKQMVVPSISLMMFFISCYILAVNQPVGVENAASVLRNVVIAPIFEELMFRGALQRTFRKYCGPAFAIFASALLFAMYHMSFRQFFYTFLLGLFCAYLAEHYSMKNAMIAHIAFNSVNSIYSLAPSAIIPILFLTGSISLIFIGKHRKQIRHMWVKPDRMQIRALFLNVPMILFTMIWALCLIADLA